MKNTTKKILMAVAIAASGLFGTINQASAVNYMPLTGRTSQPIGHAQFCQQLPQECQVRSRSTAAPTLSRKRWTDLQEVNNFANRSVQPVTDQDAYGVEEFWTYPKSYGDCEDYVLLKRYMLMQRGWPESSLLITVVKQPNGDGHAVLTVRTDRGDFVLDNLAADVKLWVDTPYRYLKRQSSTHSGRWTSIRDPRAKVARY